jgi:hypothetical protein
MSFDQTRPKGFKLSMFALEDGKNYVAQVTKQMAVAVTEGDRFTSDSINVQLVDKWMSGMNLSGMVSYIILAMLSKCVYSREHIRARNCHDLLWHCTQLHRAERILSMAHATYGVHVGYMMGLCISYTEMKLTWPFFASQWQ